MRKKPKDCVAIRHRKRERKRAERLYFGTNLLIFDMAKVRIARLFGVEHMLSGGYLFGPGRHVNFEANECAFVQAETAMRDYLVGMAHVDPSRLLPPIFSRGKG